MRPQVQGHAGHFRFFREVGRDLEETARHFLGASVLAGSFDFSLEPVRREVALIAYHFHWSRRECMNLSRRERQAWLEEIKKINQEISRAARGGRR